MSLPQDLNKRLAVKDALERALRLKELIDITESDIADIASILQDTDIIKAKAFNELLNAAYDGQQLLLKAQTKVSNVENALAEVSILGKIKAS